MRTWVELSLFQTSSHILSFNNTNDKSHCPIFVSRIVPRDNNSNHLIRSRVENITNLSGFVQL